ncbi:hypothetical protein AK812_SmicGene15504 [Symbiodinium microadriaticum]|uniref:Uncharacterized protein n=1 Tax=Symbiodinium microadriaticum TaxID=2951 RepID=A0A1Q9E2S3_SYMMI|nr:hypothetical protein AK812_SmicGene15504 [Symbiodinium microadriaticum]
MGSLIAVCCSTDRGFSQAISSFPVSSSKAAQLARTDRLSIRSQLRRANLWHMAAGVLNSQAGPGVFRMLNRVSHRQLPQHAKKPYNVTLPAGGKVPRRRLRSGFEAVQAEAGKSCFRCGHAFEADLQSCKECGHKRGEAMFPLAPRPPTPADQTPAAGAPSALCRAAPPRCSHPKMW